MQFDRLDPAELISLMLAALAGGALYAIVATSPPSTQGKHITVLAATGCPTQALCGKIAVFFGRKECRTHDIPCATISRTCHENEDNGPDARVPKSVIHLKVDAEIPDVHSRKPLAEQI